MKITLMELIAIAFMVLAIIDLFMGGKRVLDLVILGHLSLIHNKLSKLK